MSAFFGEPVRRKAITREYADGGTLWDLMA
jgi:hypothetical protein